MKLFWKTYFTDKYMLLFKGIALLCTLLVIYMITREVNLGVAVGFLVSDPFAYYMISYHERLQKLRKDLCKDEII